MARQINLARASLGIEFGSTRIKAVLIDEKHQTAAQGIYDWENRLENGLWTYSEQQIWDGLRGAYAQLREDVKRRYDQELTEVGCIGISAMMHGYLPFDAEGNLLVPFRTWRNTVTREAAELLSKALYCNFPQRWTIAHLYQAILNGEEHLPRLAFVTTLAGYVHWKLTGRKVLGMGDASGILPIDKAACDYDAERLKIYDAMAAEHGFRRPLRPLLPDVLPAGAVAGRLTAEGALMLDPTGTLKPGVPFCPPEGDAETGMVATNSILPRTGNVSAGTSIFAMVVLERPLREVHEEVGLVATPVGDLVAMVHCANCTSDLNAWEALIEEAIALGGGCVDRGELFTRLFQKSLEGEKDCGGIVPVNYFSGEGVTRLDAGVPLLARRPDSRFTLANLMRAHIYASMATLSIGLRVLREENVAVDSLLGHGGLFKTPGVAQRYLAAAAQAPIAVMETAGEGGAWGMALLASYCLASQGGCTLPLADFLTQEVFRDMRRTTVQPDPEDVAGFQAFLRDYEAILSAERAAVEALR